MLTSECFHFDDVFFHEAYPPTNKKKDAVDPALIGKDPDTGKDQRQEEKRMKEDEMVGWHHQLNRREFEEAPGDNEGQGSLACCSPRACTELDMTW